MAATVEQLREALTVLGEKIDTQTTEVSELIAAIRALLEKNPVSPDFQPEVDAVLGLAAKLDADNTAVKEALDAANPPTP